ncbi:hypothetical protein PMIN03_008769 [Paraphaeosphaeria minitans]|uniref:Uncharacterized protein n=1 Tax=Paraphaeosphaeria minitans TaxID=565426 RepID=A0A9P6GTH5_9PLEO|nr:hypothetical protein PMIN01_01091 [Paraphaeosphaeria minitans]
MTKATAPSQVMTSPQRTQLPLTDLQAQTNTRFRSTAECALQSPSPTFIEAHAHLADCSRGYLPIDEETILNIADEKREPQLGTYRDKNVIKVEYEIKAPDTHLLKTAEAHSGLCENRRENVFTIARCETNHVKSRNFVCGPMAVQHGVRAGSVPRMVRKKRLRSEGATKLLYAAQASKSSFKNCSLPKFHHAY